MFKKLFITFFLLSVFFTQNTYADRSCMTLNSSDYGTFKEFCYKITDSYLELKNKYEVNGEIDSYISSKVLGYAKTGLLYLPDSLKNKNYYTNLKTAVEKGAKYPKDSSVFDEIETSIDNFLNKTTLQEVYGKIDVYPKTGNAPLTVTLRGDVKDPSGTKLEGYNYTWWILEKGRKKVIGNRVFLNHTFREEGNYSVFLDVTSNHKNKSGNTDVLSFSKKAQIEVKEKIASTIIRINGQRLYGKEDMKFSPEESVYGLLLDATSSTPTSGTKFTKTTWDFGNGVKKTYDGSPKIERVVYATEGIFPVTLKMRTNAGRVVERKFNLIIRNPIATIRSTKSEGFLGDKFNFTANPSYKADNLTFSWEIVDLSTDKIVFNSISSTFDYSFAKKGRYNVKLQVTSPSGEKDYDNKIIFINSRPPFADFSYTIPNQSKPNTIFLDGSLSYDLDFSDDGKLKYNWIIDGDRVNLDNPNTEGSNGYYTFSSIGTHSVVLEVIDPDDMISQKKKEVNVSSLLSVDFSIFPRVTQVGKIVRFVADSPNATFFEWNFGDSVSVGSKEGKSSHKFKKSGTYDITLKVNDKNDKTNTITKKMYVADANSPYAHISIKGMMNGIVGYEKNVCNGQDAYIVDRVSNVTFSGEESIDVTGQNTGLTYSWKIGNEYYNTRTLSKRFDELSCFKVQLKVKSEKTGATDTKTTYVKVQNLKPTLSSLSLDIKDDQSDPVIVDVKAIGAEDKDGIIQSYLWYYYTDTSNEPQGFRSTKTPKTTFVLPKVTGTYYFVAVLKDNNEEKINSEDITSRYFITLAGDNLNTPIISLKVDNSSISVGQEVTFTANAENIMTKNINKESKFYWDFDGDGFYDKETISNVTTYKYKRAGEMRAKVKVSHKGFSNTRTAVINVSNILKPDFSYISIGNKFIFFNQTSGSVSKYYWSMGDGTVLNKSDSFVYEYNDKKSVHIVKLKVEDGTKTKETSKTVKRNFANFISMRRSKLNLFSNITIKDNSITLKEEIPNILLYVGTNSNDVENYGVDFDINIDSDLNGGNDDDKDNKDNSSFFNGGPLKIELNNSKNQIVRVFLIGKKGEIIETKDLKIVKEYIEEEQQVDTGSITFDGIPDFIKEKFEIIRDEVENFPKEHKQVGTKYIQRLKEEWNDDTEKTKIIMEFQGYIEESGIKNTDVILTTLSELLSDGPNATERDSQLKALKNLIPKDVKCNKQLREEIIEGQSCRQLLHQKLDAIFESRSVDDNKVLGKQVLLAIKDYSDMTVKEKEDFKAVLENLIYGSLESIPEKEKKEVTGGKASKSDSLNSSGGKSDLSFLGILKYIFYIILGIGVFIGLFYIGYRVLNKDKNKSFTDFVEEKTGETKKEDILGDSEEDNYDPLSDFDEEKTENKEQEKTEFNPEKLQNLEARPQGDKVESPDWLNIDKPMEEKTLEVEVKQEDTLSKEDENLVINSGVPDWLKGDINETPNVEENNIQEEETIEEEKEQIEKTTYIEQEKNFEEKSENTQLETKDDSDIPDWLKGSFENTSEENNEEQNLENEKSEEILEGNSLEKTEKQEPKFETKEELDELTKIESKEENSDDDIPDWLKGSFDDTSENKVIEKDNKNSEKEKKVDKKKKTSKSNTKKQTKVKELKKEVSDEKIIKKAKEDELWDDGMKVPDWLKTED